MLEKISFLLGVLLLVAASAGFLLFWSKVAHAGVLSFLAETLAGREVSGNSRDSRYNSQNIALLTAPLVADISVARSLGGIVDNTALEYQTESVGAYYQSDQISVYVVHEGDTLSQIAQMFNVSVNTIVWANDIEGGHIFPGQNLVILPISGIRHKVVSGDTLQSIAKKYGGDLKEILQYNDLSEDSKLAVGDEIIIPNAEASSSGSATTVTTSSTRQISTGYFIRPIDGGRRTQGIHGYNAVDIAANTGTRVVASASGKVIVSRNSGYNGGYGKYVVISHPNGTQTLYAHLNETNVAQGVNVEQGQVVGFVGNTGLSTGPHLHFEVRGARNPF